MKTCLDCTNCKIIRNVRFCINDDFDGKVRLTNKSFTTNHSDCSLFENIK